MVFVPFGLKPEASRRRLKPSTPQRELTGIEQPGPDSVVWPRHPKTLEILVLKENGGVFSGDLVARDVTLTVRDGVRVYDMVVHVTRMHARSMSWYGDWNEPYSF